MSGFEVAAENRWLARWVEAHRGFWMWLDDRESAFLADEIQAQPIRQPIYIAGLARSGSTILLETLAAVPGVATHRYKDFPPLLVPYFWNRLLRHLPRGPAAATERTHRDGILVTPESPEAMEEVLWMAFFPSAHDPEVSSVLDAGASNPAFERFYRNHLRKLLLVRSGERYVAKGNYNVTRLEYLQKLFPDARFVIPVRAPAAQVASLMKQHALFCAGVRESPHALDHLRRVGHFEFGPDRRAINPGDSQAVREVMGLWRDGQDVRGWARTWSLVYSHIADRLEANPALKAATCVVRFEDLCAEPRPTLAQLVEHCRLAGAGEAVDRFAAAIRAPTYYRPAFSEEEAGIIAEETAATARRFGYGAGAAGPIPAT